MDNSVLIAIITASTSIVVAALTFYLAKRHEFKVRWQDEKLNHYKVLLSSLSDLAVDGTDKRAANMKFALAVNTIALVAPQNVIAALMTYHDAIKFSNLNRSPEEHDRLLNKLMLVIRKDIGRSQDDNEATFNFHLIGSAPPEHQQ